MAETSRDDLQDLDVAAVLREHPLLSRVDEDLLPLLLRGVRVRDLVPAEAITREGSTATRFYLLVAGAARVTRTRPSGAQEVIARLQPGALFGCVGLADAQPRPNTIASVGASRCLELHRTLLSGPPRTPEGRLALVLREILGLAMTLQLRAANQRLYVMGRRFQGFNTDPGTPQEVFGGWAQPD